MNRTSVPAARAMLAGSILAGSMLGGCSSAHTPQPAAAASPSTQWSTAPIVTDVCSHVDEHLVAAILGVPAIHGVSSPKPAPFQSPPAQSCVFTPAEHVTFTVGLGPIPVAPAIAGAEVVLNLMSNGMPHMTGNLDGVGDLAYYEPPKDGSLRLDAVQGNGLRWYGVEIEGIDEIPGHQHFSHATKDQLAALANGCLHGL